MPVPFYFAAFINCICEFPGRTCRSVVVFFFRYMFLICVFTPDMFQINVLRRLLVLIVFICHADLFTQCADRRANLGLSGVRPPDKVASEFCDKLCCMAKAASGLKDMFM